MNSDRLVAPGIILGGLLAALIFWNVADRFAGNLSQTYRLACMAGADCEGM